MSEAETPGRQASVTMHCLSASLNCRRLPAGIIADGIDVVALGLALSLALTHLRLLISDGWFSFLRCLDW